jgi:hypothetical protein
MHMADADAGIDRMGGRLRHGCFLGCDIHAGWNRVYMWLDAMPGKLA